MANKDGIAGGTYRYQPTLFGGFDRLRVRQRGQELSVDGFACTCFGIIVRKL